MYFRIICILFFFSVQLLYSQEENNCVTAKETTRIVVAGGSIAEIIYFLNQQEKIVGVDVTSTYPDPVKKLPSIGYVRNLSAEGILSLKPNLVIGEDDMGPPHIIKQLNSARIDVKIVPEEQTAQGIIKKINCIASILGVSNFNNFDKYKEKIQEVNQLKELRNKKTQDNIKIMLILSMRGTSPVVAGKGTSGNSFIEMIGGKNIFKSVNGWKAVTLESIIHENPDFIIMPQKEMHANSNTNEILENPFFANTNAVKNGNFIFVDGMAVLGFGPRTITSALEIAKQIRLK